MSETITKGYLIKKIDYQVFDEVLTFLTEEGFKPSCLSLGSKKIESKNGRNIFFGHKLEIQYFASRSVKKISKLKKVINLEELDWQLQSNIKLMLLNEMAENIQPSIGLFNFYEAKLNEIKTLKEDENTFILRTLREFCNFVGVHLEVNRCIRCSSNILKTISFKHNGMLCNHCSRELFVKPEDIRFSKLINHLFNNQYDQMNQYYDMFPYAIKCISKYIFDTAGIKLQTLKSY